MGLVQVKTPTTGVPAAAARCIGPESLESTTSAVSSTAANCGSVVAPETSIPWPPADLTVETTRAASGASSRLPTATTVPGNCAAVAANFSTGQRLVSHPAPA